ncbi:HIT family protein [Kineobactrum sediminis]|uniref:HIT family protein n=1 Tax=Kineobactrum sediminis TaxID=1905677 RepID=A0A2N5Y258_9GAMM|nr:HIT family protein [Kineobactrum sediminis]PLW82468.1 HIT family protein [Kineobactrum sediminis]
MPAPELHSQLLADCHLLGTVPSGSLLLSRNAALHWFILVPDTTSTDLLDLPPGQLEAVMTDCRKVSACLKQTLAYPKVNFAALGNVVPQLHLHIIGRRHSDPCWPQPIWGNLPPGPDWSDEELAALREVLIAPPVHLLPGSDHK